MTSRIIEINDTKVQEIRGYMSNSTKTCATGTCICGGCHMKIDEAIEKALSDIPEEFFID